MVRPLTTLAIVLLYCLLSLTAAEARMVTLYVSPAGRDTWSGKLAAPNKAGSDGPLASLAGARQAIRALRAGGKFPDGGVTVLVKGGTYRLNESFSLTGEDSGTATAPVVYRAAPGEVVRLSGACPLPAAAFTPLKDDIVAARLQPAVRAKVLQADLKALGLTALGEFPPRYRGAPAVPELFCNDTRMSLARWPNEGWARVEKIIDSGSIPRTGDSGTRGGIFTYKEDSPARWQIDQGVWLQGYWCFDWFDETIRVKALDPATRQITLAEPTVYGVKQGNPSPRRYRALNLLEELDSPGEYYIDRENGRLLFYPPGPLKNARLTLSQLNAPLVSLTDAAYVTLRGFILEDGLADGIDLTGGSHNRIEACELRNLRQLGMSVQGGEAHRLDACDIHHTGTGGVILSGGDRKTLTPAGHEAVNCHVWRYSEHQLTYANAFLIQGVGNRVAHCLIHDAPHQAIGVGGNDHIFEYNIVHHICTETDDCGAYYKGRNASCRGNIVRYNFFHNIGSPMGHGNAAVYFDDGDGGDIVFGNVFFRCGEPGRGSFGTVFSHGGFNLKADNNVFVECKRAFGSAPWNDKRWADFLKEPDRQKQLLQEVDVTKPPYSTRYPDLDGLLEPGPEHPRVSTARRNLIVMGAAVSGGNWQAPESENWVTDKDPGFVDAAKGNFALRPDAPVFKQLPGFEPIPFAKMGLYKDALRPNPPVEKWTYPAPHPLEPLTKTAAAAAVKTGPVPVFRVTRAAAPAVIDGQAGAGEYGGAAADKALPLAVDVSGTPASRSGKAWLTYDDRAVYVLIDNALHPNEKLDGNQWGTDPAVELSFQTVREGKAPPIYVLRAYANGRVEFGSTPDGAQEPLTMDPGNIVYRAQHPQPGRWLAELSIPLAMLDLDPAATPRVRFSLAVRKPLDDLWLMWEPTRGHTYDVGQAGILEFVK